MSLRETNFDGIVGPSHNYAGLSLGNVASMRHAGAASEPKAAALQGIEKMRANLSLGLSQGIFLPHPRPDRPWLAELGTTIEQAEPALAANAMSASAMWAANAATVSPAPDTADGKCHLTVANLRTMPHRSHEWPATLAQLQLAFASDAFAVHDPVPAAFGDEGAANHMRLARSHGEPGVEVFVYGVSGGAFPARQHLEASKAIARLHGLDPARILAEQSEEAIAAGAFHNDVVAVANERVLFAHEKAFADKAALIDTVRAARARLRICRSAGCASAAWPTRSGLIPLQRPAGDAAGRTARRWSCRAKPRDALSVALDRGHSPGTDRSAKSRSSTSASRWRMAVGPACLPAAGRRDPGTVDPRFWSIRRSSTHRGGRAQPLAASRSTPRSSGPALIRASRVGSPQRCLKALELDR